MTRFSTPFKWKLPYVDTTVARVDTSGTATFKGLTSEGAIQGGTPAGFAEMVQRTTVNRSNSAATTVARVPDNSDILGFVVHVKTAFATANASAQVGTVNLLLGDVNDDNLHTTIALSAAQVYTPATPLSSAASLFNVSGSGAAVLAKVTAVGSASPDEGEAVVFTRYIQR